MAHLRREERARLLALIEGSPETDVESSAVPGSVTALDRLINALPYLGGTAGGVIGGTGGTVAGLGVGGIPGAMGGAALGGVGGEGLRQAIQTWRGVEAPRDPTAALTRLAAQGAGQAAAEGVGLGVARTVAKSARGIYRGYLKPSLAKREIRKAPLKVETAIEEGLPISRAGVAKGERLIGALNAEVEQLITAAHGIGDLRAIAKKVRAFATRQYHKPGADPGAYKAALAVADRIDRHPSLRAFPTAFPRAKVSVAELQDLKRTLQASARESYGVPHAGATEAAEKVGARAARRTIEDFTGGPGGRVAQLNARESRLLDSVRAIHHAVEREASQQKVYGVRSLWVPGTAAGAASVAGLPWPAAVAGGLALRKGLQPEVMTNVAILAARVQRKLGIGIASANRLAAYVVQEALGQNPREWRPTEEAEP